MYSYFLEYLVNLCMTPEGCSAACVDLTLLPSVNGEIMRLKYPFCLKVEP